MTFQIEWIVNKLHINTPDRDIIKNIGDRLLRHNDEVSVWQVIGVIGYALQVHHSNQDEFRRYGF